MADEDVFFLVSISFFKVAFCMILSESLYIILNHSKMHVIHQFVSGSNSMGDKLLNVGNIPVYPRIVRSIVKSVCGDVSSHYIPRKAVFSFTENCGN